MSGFWKASFKGLVCALFLAGFALALCAYGQSPPDEDSAKKAAPTAADILRRLRERGRQQAPARQPARTAPARRGERPTRPEPKAPAKPAVTRPTPARAQTRPAGAKTIQGKAGAKGGAVRTVSPGGAAGVSVQGGVGTFDPIFSKPVEYGEVPDVGEELTITGPMPMSEFLDTLAIATNWNVLVSELAQAVNLQFWVTETTPKQALEILKFHDIYYEFDPETQFLYVMTKDEHLDKEYGDVKPETFVIEHVDIAYIESMISSLLSANGRLITDPRTMHMYVWDTKDNLEEMRKKIEELDVPLQRAEFTVHYADLTDIEAVFQTLLTQTGTVITDPRTGQMFVWDVPDALNQMRLAFKELDVPLESRVFKLQHVDAEALTESIEVLLSERGMIQVDPRINTLIIRDLPSRQDDIARVIETLDEKLETRTWTVRYADPEVVAENVEVLVPEEMGIVTVNQEIHQITITALPERLDEIDKLIQTWDIKRKQVQIEAYLLTAGSDFTREFGMNWAFFDSTGNAPISIQKGTARPTWGATQDTTDGANGDTTITTGTATTQAEKVAKSGQTFSIGQLPYSVPLRNWFTGDVITDLEGNPIIKALGGNRVSAVINYLDSRGDVTILSHPRVTVQDGEEAIFEKTSQVPYVTSSSYGRSTRRYYDTTGTTDTSTTAAYRSAYRPSNQIDFIEVGTILSVIPRITEDKNILLDISAEESNYEMIDVVGADELSTVPQKTQNRTETQVLVHDGETIVIGGLRVGDVNDQVEKVPILGDLPLIGRAFRNTNKLHKNRELLIFITTTLVGEYTFPETERLAKAEEMIGETHRHDEKNIWGRIGADYLKTTRNKIGVSIGQGGHMHSGGKPVTLEGLRKRFYEVDNPSTAKVIIRKHPRAPARVATEVTEIALEAGLKFEYDDAYMPFVPAYRIEEPEASEAVQGPAETSAEPVVSTEAEEVEETGDAA